MYGSDLKTQHCVRSTPPKILLPDGKIQLTDDGSRLLTDGKLYWTRAGHLPIDPDASDRDPHKSSRP